MMVLCIIAVVFIGAMFLAFNGHRERMLRDAAQEISSLARQTRLKAATSGVPQNIVLQRDNLQQRANQPKEKTTRVELANQLELWARFPGSDWERASGQLWPFAPNGTATPITLRVEGKGGYWIELQFDFLTASIKEENHVF